MSCGGESCGGEESAEHEEYTNGRVRRGEYYTSHFVKFNFMFVCVSVGRLGHDLMKL